MSRQRTQAHRLISREEAALRGESRWRCGNCDHNWTYHEPGSCMRQCRCVAFVPTLGAAQGDR